MQLCRTAQNVPDLLYHKQYIGGQRQLNTSRKSDRSEHAEIGESRKYKTEAKHAVSLKLNRRLISPQ